LKVPVFFRLPVRLYLLDGGPSPGRDDRNLFPKASVTVLAHEIASIKLAGSAADLASSLQPAKIFESIFESRSWPDD
jgi:hypothetical protein